MSDYVFFVAFVSSKSRNPFYENKEIMKIAQNWTDYSIIATGDGYKLERWKNVYLLRPDPQVIWSAQTDLFSYPKLNAYYKRSEKRRRRLEIFEAHARGMGYFLRKARP